MTLDNQQKQLLFDYCVGVTDEFETAQAEQLIGADDDAMQLCAQFKKALKPLDLHFDLFAEQQCPPDIAEKTISRLSTMAKSSQQRLGELIADEQTKTIKPFYWKNFAQVAATAAAVLIVTLSIIAPLSYARQNYWKQACQMQLQKIGQGFINYGNDHNGQLPEVASAAGQPWWKVGYQGQENHSNTRNVWLLTKGGYVNAADFICPAKSQGRVTQFDPAKAKQYNDFPARRYITYSFRIKSMKPCAGDLCKQRVLITDLNPLFEKLPNNYSQAFVVKINNSLSHINSSNHNGHGQNILFGDGSVDFLKTRLVGLQQDDVFTLQNKSSYEGNEIPVSSADMFVAP